MTKPQESSPLSISTKIPIYWILAVALALGSWTGTESISRASFEDMTIERMDRIEQNVCLTQENLNKMSQLVQSAYTERAVFATDLKHMTTLLTEIRRDVKELKDGM
jgi:hypothetical protein